MPSEREHPVLLHIEDAEAWLARAKAHYRRAAAVRGELDLSLAQAEVRYAWELSRKRRAGEPGLCKAPRSPSFIHWLPLVAASLVLFLALIFFLGGWPRPVTRKAPLAASSLSRPSEQGEERKAPSPVVSLPASPSGRKMEPSATRKNQVQISHPTVAEAVPSSSPAPPGSTVEEGGRENEDEVSLPEGVPPEAEPESRPSGQDVLSPREDLRPVSLDLAELERVAKETLMLDREALRK